MKSMILKVIFLLCLPLASVAQDATPQAERHEFVKRGNHKQELKMGDYVVVGVFKSEENAQKVAEGYKKETLADASFGYCSAKSLWFVTVGTSNDIEEARANRNKLRQQHKAFQDAWLLTVHQ